MLASAAKKHSVRQANAAVMVVDSGRKASSTFMIIVKKKIRIRNDTHVAALNISLAKIVAE
jgi:hypothetical protein